MDSNFIIIGFIFIILLTTILFGLYVFLKSTRQLRHLLQRKYALEAETKSKIARRYLHEKILNKDIMPVYHRLNDLKTAIDQLPTSKQKERMPEHLEEVYMSLEQLEQTVRDISASIYPPGLQKFFCETCQSNIEKIKELHQFQGEIQFLSEGIFDILEDNETILFNLYSLIDLFVTNSVKHAQADIIIIHLVSKEHIIRLTMRDNGKGFDFSTVEKKIGNNNHRGIADIQGLTIACNPVIKEYHSHINQGTFYKIIIELKQH